MPKSEKFKTLAEEGSIIGEVVGVERFLVTIRGLDTAPIGSLIVFEDGNTGMIWEVQENRVFALTLTTESIKSGQLAALSVSEPEVGVGESMLGRMVTPFGEPLDGEGDIKTSESRGIFKKAPGIIEREKLTDQLPTGVTIVDTLFNVIRGQRIAVLGDRKTGKTTLMDQLTHKQKGTDRIVVYTLIGKQKQDIERVYQRLKARGVLENVIIVATDVLNPLPLLYLAPYAACAIAEHFWLKGKDCVVIYDDLSIHAKVYREISLLLKISPGRQSYPGDIFYIHSSLLERAGKLKETGSSLTAIPVVSTPNNDITGYIPTNLISITDGQLFFDTEIFNKGRRPAINTGLSVSRLAERVRTQLQEEIATGIAKRLAAYNEALEFARFGSKVSEKVQEDLRIGSQIFEFFQQGPEEIIGGVAQQIVLETILMNEGKAELDIKLLQDKAKDIVSNVSTSEDVKRYAQELLNSAVLQK